GMVVQKYHGRCRFFHRHREDFPRMHDAQCETAFGYRGVAHNGVLGIQKDDLEDFMAQVAQGRMIMLEEIPAGGDFGSSREWRRERPFAEGKGRFQLRGFGRPYPWYRAEFIDTAARQPAQTPEAIEDFEADLNLLG